MNKIINIKFGNLTFPRNGVLASGIMGVTGWSMVKIAQSGAGGVTSKSISKNIRKGYKSPVIQIYEAGMLNAVGLSSTGIENSNKELKIAKDNSDAVIIASVFGETSDEFKETIDFLDETVVDAVEINISCPNVKDEYDAPFSASPKTTEEVVDKVRKATKLPFFVKLSPNFPNIGNIAKAAEEKGADAITAINTIGPGMLIDINTYKPKLTNKTGGLSGPAILPIAIRCVYDIYKSVKIPIIGMGGITNVEDAIQIILAGAALYGVGTGIIYGGINIFNDINNGIEQYLSNKKMNYTDLIGLVHK